MSKRKKKLRIIQLTLLIVGTLLIFITYSDKFSFNQKKIVSEENQEIFLENGGERLDLVPALNDSEDWAKCVVKIIQDYI